MNIDSNPSPKISINISESSSSNSMESLSIGSSIVPPTTDTEAYSSDSENAQQTAPSTRSTDFFAQIRIEDNPILTSNHEKLETAISNINSELKLFIAAAAKKYVFNIDRITSQIQNHKENIEKIKKEEKEAAKNKNSEKHVDNINSQIQNSKKPDLISYQKLALATLSEIFTHSEKSKKIDNQKNTLEELLATLLKIFTYSEKSSQEWHTSYLGNSGNLVGTILEVESQTGNFIYRACDGNFYFANLKLLWDNIGLNYPHFLAPNFNYFGTIEYMNPGDPEPTLFEEGEYFLVEEGTSLRPESNLIAKKNTYLRNDSDTSLIRNINRAQKLCTDTLKTLQECETFLSEIEEIISSRKVLMQYFAAGIIFTATSASLLFAFIYKPVVILIAVYASINLIINAFLLYKFQNVWKSYSETHELQSQLDILNADLKTAFAIRTKICSMLSLSNNIRHAVDTLEQEVKNTIEHQKHAVDAEENIMLSTITKAQEIIDTSLAELNKVAQELKGLFPNIAASENHTDNITSPLHIV